MQPATYRTVIGKDFQRLVRPPQAAPVPTNTDAAEMPRYVQLHAAQVDQWRQMVNVEDILKQKLVGSLEDKYFKGKRQAYINYANRTLVVLIQHLYDDHGTISPMDIEESEQKMKQEWLLLDPMVDLFEQIEKVVEFAEAANTPIPGGKVVNIAYLLILSTVGMEKSCEQWEDIRVGLKTWQAFKCHFAQAYRRYQIRKKATAAAHGFGASANHTQETESQVNTADALQALACAAMEDKEAMANLTSINLTLSQSLTQAQETILVLSNQLKALQVHTKSKTPSTNRTVLDQKTKDDKSKCYCWTHGRTRRLDHTSATCNFPNTGHQVGATIGDKMGGSEKWCEEEKDREYYGEARNTVLEKINYNHHLILIQILPTSSTRSPPQPHTDYPISESGFTGHYLYSLTTIVHTRDPSENSINVKLPNSSIMESTHQSQIPLKKLSSQAKHA